MLRTRPVDHVAAGPERGRARAIVVALAVTQTVGYGALYYSFAVLLTPLARDLHTSAAAVTGALTAATLAGALAAVPVGAWLDRHGGRALMSVGSVAGTGLLALMSTVDSVPGLYAVWIGIGVASAMVLYEAAFAVVIAWHPTSRGRANALLAVTVVAGFASSIFFPLTAALVQAYGWRIAALVLAAVHGTLTIPLHAVVLRRRPGISRGEPLRQLGHDPDAVRRAAVRGALRDRGFWLLTSAFVTHTAAVATLSVHLVSYLIQAGHQATFAASVAGLLGVLSVAGRLVTTGLQRRVRPTTVIAAVFAVQSLAAFGLPLVGETSAGAVIAVAGFGLGFGVGTIARPALLAARYGTAGYATIAGTLTVPTTIAKAAAPVAAAFLRGVTGDYTVVLVASAVACALSAALVVAGSAPPRPDAATGGAHPATGSSLTDQYERR